MKRCLPRVLGIDRESFGEEAWDAEQFVVPRPGKYTLSRVALLDSRPIGYLIASIDSATSAHVHRFAVDLEKRGVGVGSSLMESLLSDEALKSCEYVTLESTIGRREANALYRRHGFARLSRREVAPYLRERGRISEAHLYTPEYSKHAEQRIIYRLRLVHSELHARSSPFGPPSRWQWRR
jgi:ribosomal-protein-alanine N-acetyltransferase